MRESGKKIIELLGLHEIVVKTRNAWRQKRLHSKKVSIILSHIQHFHPRIFVETGTFQGDTVEQVKNHFKNAYSIEVGKELYEKAKERFSKDANVEIFLGDSRVVLPKTLSLVREPALFWLDAHYSGFGTSKADIITPIEEELRLIFNHSVRKHIILIDDARDFIGTGDYPTPDKIKNMAEASGYSFQLEDNIFRIIPRSS